MKSFKIFLFFLFIRILSVFVVKTWYVPDEYWQSLEVGHKLAFGYGHLTWEWAQGIRSYLHPLIIAGVYKLLEILKLDQVQFLILIPRILQAFLTSFADYRFYKWSGQSKWSIFMIASSWFWFYTGSRTLANTVETALSTIALSYFPWENSEKTEFLWPVSLICLIRPTAAIQWIPLCIYHIKKSKFSVWEIILKRYLLIGLVTASYTIAIDSYCHGSLIFTPWEFVKANVIDGIGSFYGEHKWHWYVTAGLPTVLGITTLPFIGAIVESIRNKEIYPTKKIILGSISFSVIVYSLIAHKEFRFILSLLPMCLYLTSEFLGRWSRKASKLSVWIVAIALFVGNVFPAAYIGFVHQKGTIDVMPVLGKIAREYKDENGASAKLLFLMPCHSTPYYSHIHYNVSMRFLTCEPNLMKKEHYLDEADKFYQDPAPFLRSHFPVYPKNALPTHLILFDILVDKIQDFLINYKLRDTLFHSDIASDRIGKNVVVYERIDTSKPITQHKSTIEVPPTQTDELDDEF